MVSIDHACLRLDLTTEGEGLYAGNVTRAARERRLLRFVTSQKADGASQARFRAPRGSSSLTGTHPSSPSYLIILFCTSLAWRLGSRTVCVCVPVRVHQVRKKPPVPTRGALGVGSVSYRGRGTIMRIERDRERAFRRERAERNTERKRDSRYSYRRGRGPSSFPQRPEPTRPRSSRRFKPVCVRAVWRDNLFLVSWDFVSRRLSIQRWRQSAAARRTGRWAPFSPPSPCRKGPQETSRRCTCGGRNGGASLLLQGLADTWAWENDRSILLPFRSLCRTRLKSDDCRSQITCAEHDAPHTLPNDSAIKQ